MSTLKIYVFNNNLAGLVAIAYNREDAVKYMEIKFKVSNFDPNDIREFDIKPGLYLYHEEVSDY